MSPIPRGPPVCPRGVVVENRNLANAYFAWENAYGLKDIHSHLQMADFTFDVFAGDLVRSLCSGAVLVICPKPVLLDPETLFSLMEKRTDRVCGICPGRPQTPGRSFD